MSASESSASNGAEVVNKEVTERRSRWSSSRDAVKHIADSFGSEGKQVRSSDKATSILLVFVALAATAYVLFPGYRSAVLVLADIVAGGTIVVYLANRLGIFTSLDSRKTVIIAELLLGMFVLSILLMLNAIALREVAVSVLTNL